MSLHDRYEQNLEKCVKFLKDWKDLIDEHLDNDESEVELQKLKKTTLDYCDINKDFQKSSRVLDKVQQQLNETNEESTVDVQRLYEQNLKNDTDIEESTESDIWKNVFKGTTDVIEVRQKNKQLQDNQFDELDDSLFCSNVFTPPIDPISKAVIREPVRNKKCKHVYERAMIVDYIKHQKRKAKCPYIGCNSTRLLITDLVEDNQLQSQIMQYMENRADDDTEEEDD